MNLNEVDTTKEWVPDPLISDERFLAALRS